jgi:hypothetical protein
MNTARWFRPHRLILAVSLLNIVLYSLLLPLWEGFDEPFHYGYIQNLANGDSFPNPLVTHLSLEIGNSIAIAPASLSVQINLPEVVTYQDYFTWPQSRRNQMRAALNTIPEETRYGFSHFLNYEGQQAPLAYILLAPAERILAGFPLPERVGILRILSGSAGVVLLIAGTAWACRLLEISETLAGIVIFCLLSTQMTLATMARIGNEWLALPVAVCLLASALDYHHAPTTRRAVTMAVLLGIGLLTKAWFLAFLPLLFICALERRYRDLIAALLIVVAIAGAWYARNVILYHEISGVQDWRFHHADPTEGLRAFRFSEIPTAVDAWARAGLWTANNTFRSFSRSTLSLLLSLWGAAILMWLFTRHRAREWIVVAYCGLSGVELLTYVALLYSVRHEHIDGPAPWYSQILFPPLLMLAALGMGRFRIAGKAVAAALTLIFGYVLICTYWVKLIPLYGGFDQRTSLAAVIRLYAGGLNRVAGALNPLTPGPGGLILTLSAALTIAILAQQFLLIRSLFRSPQQSSFPDV